jgi:hypothetical protein
MIAKRPLHARHRILDAGCPILAAAVCGKGGKDRISGRGAKRLNFLSSSKPLNPNKPKGKLMNGITPKTATLKERSELTKSRFFKKAGLLGSRKASPVTQPGSNV